MSGDDEEEQSERTVGVDGELELSMHVDVDVVVVGVWLVEEGAIAIATNMMRKELKKARQQQSTNRTAQYSTGERVASISCASTAHAQV